MQAPKIKKLDENVINRIAAGEVIQRPANALKEMIENSLDAQATNIQITVKNGGMKLLQIHDNGTGIRKDDMEIVCERFTTSKLRSFEDLNAIATYGFRGEALASISHVAHLTIQSKTADQACAYKAAYVDGKMDGPSKPTAGNQGTQITVEDLFYNMSLRKRALRSVAEEYQKISDVVGKYAIHNAHVGFSLKKSGESIDIKTPCNSNQADNIRIIYGNAVAKQLIEFEVENEEYKLKARGFLTNVNYTNKKFHFLLFINHRLVDCQSLKKCIDQVYTNYLPKNMHPFVYLSLELDPKNIDVNVHPTKHEVHFLNEEQIVELIVACVESKLLGSDDSRIFYTQSKLPGAVIESIKPTDKMNSANQTVHAKDLIRTDCSQPKLETFFGNNAMKTGEKASEIVRKPIKLADEEINVNETISSVDSVKENIIEKTLEKSMDIVEETIEVTNEEKSPNQTKLSIDMVATKTNNFAYPSKKSDKPKIKDAENKVEHNESVEDILNTTEDNRNFESMIMKESPRNTESKENKFSSQVKASLISRISRSETQLTSILELREEMEHKLCTTLRELFAQHVFVGCVDPTRALLQYSTNLYLCNTNKIMEELFYQILLYNFANFGKIRFNTPLSILELAQIALDLPETGWTAEDGDKKELAERVVEILAEKSEMLEEYFSIEIDENACIKSIPHLLEKYLPEMSALPFYILRLASEVNWEQEKNCFKTICRETAMFYSKMKEGGVTEQDWKWTTEHVIYPTVKDCFLPPKKFLENGAVLQIADLPNLYRVFERC